MNRLETDHTTESHALRRHLCNRVRCFSSRGADASVVKQNDLMIRREAVRYCRVPRIHVGVEVSKKEQRNRPCFAETTVGIPRALSLNKLCGNRVVCVMAHGCLSTLLPVSALLMHAMDCRSSPSQQPGYDGDGVTSPFVYLWDMTITQTRR